MSAVVEFMSLARDAEICLVRVRSGSIGRGEEGHVLRSAVARTFDHGDYT